MTIFNFTLSPQSTQKVHEALLCLSKFSEFVSLEARRNQLCLSALNSTKSAYGAVRLSANKFCEEFKFVPEDGEERFQCRLQVKALLSVFRQRYLDSKDKSTSISRCEVRLSTTPPECRILIKLLCNHGVLKTYKLTYEEVDIMHAIFDKGFSRQYWKISSSLLKEHMEHFGTKAEQLDISSAAASGRAAFTSFTEKLIDGKEILKQPLQTSVALDTGDFDEFQVEDGVRVSVSLKDFKAITGHASTLEVPVEARFSGPGRPMQVAYARDGMDVEFTLMTAADVRASQSLAVAGRIVTVQRRNDELLQQSRESTVAHQQRQESAVTNGPRLSSVVQQHDESHQSAPAPMLTNKQIDEDDSSLYRQPTLRAPSTPLPPSTPRPPPMPPTPPPPPQTTSLFLNYSDNDDDDEEFEDMVRTMDNERGSSMLGWDTSGGAGSGTTGTRTATSSRARTIPEDGHDDEDEGEGEEGEEGEVGIGPTQQSVPPPRGLFD